MNLYSLAGGLTQAVSTHYAYFTKQPREIQKTLQTLDAVSKTCFDCVQLLPGWGPTGYVASTFSQILTNCESLNFEMGKKKPLEELVATRALRIATLAMATWGFISQSPLLFGASLVAQACSEFVMQGDESFFEQLEEPEYWKSNICSILILGSIVYGSSPLFLTAAGINAAWNLSEQL